MTTALIPYSTWYLWYFWGFSGSALTKGCQYRWISLSRGIDAHSVYPQGGWTISFIYILNQMIITNDADYQKLKMMHLYIITGKCSGTRTIEAHPCSLAARSQSWKWCPITHRWTLEASKPESLAPISQWHQRSPSCIFGGLKRRCADQCTSFRIWGSRSWRRGSPFQFRLESSTGRVIEVRSFAWWWSLECWLPLVWLWHSWPSEYCISLGALCHWTLPLPSKFQHSWQPHMHSKPSSSLECAYSQPISPIPWNIRCPRIWFAWSAWSVRGW